MSKKYIDPTEIWLAAEVYNILIKIILMFYEAECPGGCRNGGVCNERHVCECPDGFYGPHCEKGNLIKDLNCLLYHNLKKTVSPAL